MDFLEKFKVVEYKGQPVTCIQRKFDGYYAELYKAREFGIVVCMKKQNINLWPKLKHHHKIREQVDALPWDTILRCELHGLGIPATSVPTLINDADPKLLLSPFKIEAYDGIQISQSKIYESKTYEVELLKEFGFLVPKLHILSDKPESLSENDMIDWKQAARAVKWEGWVLCNHVLDKYYKLKPQKTVDAFVVDYQISDSDSFMGGLKSVQIAVYDGAEEKIIASVGSGFDGDYRMTVKPKTLIGRVAEFEYQTLGARGRLIFPRFLRWRDDEKLKEQCIMNQLI